MNDLRDLYPVGGFRDLYNEEGCGWQRVIGWLLVEFVGHYEAWDFHLRVASPASWRV